MDIFETLVSEHRVISGVFDALERFVDSAEASRELDLVELNRFATFIREYVELFHHEREENLLLPAMEALGYARDGAPIALIRKDHERERSLSLDLRRTAAGIRPPAAVERARVFKTARDLIAFERVHMKRENEILYPAVKKELSGTTLAELSKRMASRGGTWTEMVEQTWLHSLAEELMRDHSDGAEPRRHTSAL